MSNTYELHLDADTLEDHNEVTSMYSKYSDNNWYTGLRIEVGQNNIRLFSADQWDNKEQLQRVLEFNAQLRQATYDIDTWITGLLAVLGEEKELEA